MNELEFSKMVEERGFGEIEQGEVEPGYDEEAHTHEYSVLSLILAGEFVLTTQDETTVLMAGDWCEIPAGTLHKEQTGSDIGSYMVAKK
jgi:quercetin dioxygenase-like cupin family protein